jgi:hypothetical protein
MYADAVRCDSQCSAVFLEALLQFPMRYFNKGGTDCKNALMEMVNTFGDV